MMESPTSPNLSLDLIANLARIARGLASLADVVESRHEKTPGKHHVSQFEEALRVTCRRTCTSLQSQALEAMISRARNLAGVVLTASQIALDDRHSAGIARACSEGERPRIGFLRLQKLSAFHAEDR